MGTHNRLITLTAIHTQDPHSLQEHILGTVLGQRVACSVARRVLECAACPLLVTNGPPHLKRPT
jgi:hypothetical protein